MLGNILAVSPYLFTFRIIHVVFAIAWGGAAFLFFFFVEPTQRAIGPQAGPFMGEMMGRRRLPIVINSIATVVVVAGGGFFFSAPHGCYTASVVFFSRVVVL